MEKSRLTFQACFHCNTFEMFKIIDFKFTDMFLFDCIGLAPFNLHQLVVSLQDTRQLNYAQDLTFFFADILDFHLNLSKRCNEKCTSCLTP